jgi:hypothetical protein
LRVKPELTQSEAPLGASCKGKLRALPTNIRLGWKVLTRTDTVAYYEHSQITAVKSFMRLDQGPKWIDFGSDLLRQESVDSELKEQIFWAQCYINFYGRNLQCL